MSRNIIRSIFLGKILGKYFTKSENESELQQIKSWIKEDQKNQDLINELGNEKNLALKLEKLDSYDEVESWKILNQKIQFKRQFQIIRRWKVAAVIFLLIGIGGVVSNFINTSVEKNSVPENLETTVQTQRGQSSRVLLPDGSVVHLNSATNLSYSNNFMAANRSVSLAGEAYFEVAKNENLPFIVDCEDVKVKVFGTEFNVNTFRGENKVDVILDHGSVELSHIQNKFEKVMLIPGELAHFDEDLNVLNISNVDSYKYTSWKDGVLVFEDDPMAVVLKKLESWYDIDIEVKDNKVYDLIFNATIMDESIEDIFDLIKFSCDINYQVIYSQNPKVVSKVIVSLN